VGSPLWMAPEVMLKSYNNKIDVFSFGIILWELWTRRMPYSDCGLKPLEILFKVAKDGFRPTIPAGFPPVISALMQRCWAQNPNERPTFQQVLIELRSASHDPFFQ